MVIDPVPLRPRAAALRHRATATLARAAALALATAICACKSPEAPPLHDDVGRFAPPVLGLSAGSVIEIKFYYTPELDVVQTVRPDGKVSMQLIGDVQVAGLQPEELRQRLIELYASELEQPEIAVLVQSQAHRQILVGGAVVSPGLVPMPTHMTVLQALMRAGGPDLLTGNVRNVVVIRDDGEERQGFAVNLHQALKGLPDDRPFYLQPEDIVYVPRRRIVDIDQWIDQNINQIVPKIGIRASQTSTAGSYGIDTSTR